jgi:hypothetical protein
MYWWTSSYDMESISSHEEWMTNVWPSLVKYFEFGFGFLVDLLVCS